MKNKRLSLEDRKKIQELLSNNINRTEICKKVGIWKSTLYREFKKCTGKYNAEAAHKSTINGFHPIDWKIIGRKFGLLTIESYIGIEKHRTWWNATCECGNTTKISR